MRRWLPLCCGIAFLGLLAAAPTGDQFTKHTVKKGETVSLLCIELFGHYQPAMGDALKKDNPELTDINVIRVGQVLTFRNPSYKPTAPADIEAAKIFESKVNATQGVVTYVEGTATLYAQGAKTATPLKVNALVAPGDAIQTGAPGRVEIVVNRESVVRIRENSRLTLEAFRDNAKKSGVTRVDFRVGSVWTKVKKLAQGAVRFQLEMPTVTAGVHGTIYQASVARDSSADVQVYDGEVEVKGQKPAATQPSSVEAGEVSGPEEVAGPQEVSMEDWTQIVRSMQRIKVDKKGNPSAPAAFVKNPNDDWVKWNEERDKRLAQVLGEGI